MTKFATDLLFQISANCLDPFLPGYCEDQKQILFFTCQTLVEKDKKFQCILLFLKYQKQCLAKEDKKSWYKNVPSNLKVFTNV